MLLENRHRVHRTLPGTLLLSGLLLAACEPVATPTLSPGLSGGVSEVVEPMPINEVQVIGADAQPPQPAAVIEGVIGDSCSQLDSEAQSRDANVISIQINVRRTTGPGVACQELAQLYNQTLPLEGEFPPGDYTLLVNGTARTFTIAPVPTSTPQCSFNSELVGHVTFPEGSLVAPGEPFVKTWRVRNTGTCPWDENFRLAQIEGDAISARLEAEPNPLPRVEPGQEADVSLELLVTPGTALESQQLARFQMRDPSGQPFGELLSVQVTVAESTVDLASECIFDSEFVRDVTIPDGSPVVPGVPFVKTWRIRNTGTCPWDESFHLVQIRGDTILPTGEGEPLPLPPAAPGEEIDISIELMLSPETPLDSEQEARFQIRSPEGKFFGTYAWVRVTAAESQ